MNKTQQDQAKWYKIWNFLRDNGCKDQLGIPQEDIAIDFIKKLLKQPHNQSLKGPCKFKPECRFDYEEGCESRCRYYIPLVP